MKSIVRSIWNRHIFLLTLLVILSVLLSACAGVINDAYYRGEAGQLTSDMKPFKSEAMKLDFLVPSGWEKIDQNAELPDAIYLKRDISTETGGMAVFRKGDKGSVMVWCRTSQQTPHYMRREIVDRMVSENQIVKGPLQLESEGWNPVFFRYDANYAIKGEKFGFSIFVGEKSEDTFSLYGCRYGVVARSATADVADEIESDFIAILRSLKN